MPRWTYHLQVYNHLDRTLKLDNCNIPWGEKDGGGDNFPSSIAAGQSGYYHVYSAAGKPSGIEFYLNFSDEVPEGGSQYGTVKIAVDMPYWKHANTSSCTTTGLIKATGFEKVPDGNHDFSTSVTFSRSL